MTEPAGAGVAGTLVSTGMLAGARRLAGTGGVSTPAVAVGAEMSLGVGTPAEAAGTERPQPESALVTFGSVLALVTCGNARGTGNLGGSDSGAGSWVLCD